jgi:GNAT superfamily N-acetyltransferase
MPVMQFDWVESVSETDGRQMVSIINAVAAKEGTNGFSQPLSETAARKLVERLNYGLKHGDCQQLFARETQRGEVVSIVTLEGIKIPARSHTVELKRMATAPAWRGAAGGRFLIHGWRVILDRCRALGYDILNIDVSEDGPYQLWQRFGFEIYAKVADYARVGDRRLDGYFLSVYLDAAYARLAEIERAGAGANRRPSATSS